MGANFSQSAMLARIQAHALAGDVDIDYYSPTAFKGQSVPTAGLSDTIVIDGDAAFVLYQMNGAIYGQAGDQISPTPNVLLDIRSAGSGRYFSQNPMHWTSVIGNGQNPFYLPEPKLIAPNTQIILTLSNLSGGAYNQAFLTWVGAKLFMRGRFTLQDLSLPVDFAYSR